jgi:hypothetical protein
MNKVKKNYFSIILRLSLGGMGWSLIDTLSQKKYPNSHKSIPVEPSDNLFSESSEQLKKYYNFQNKKSNPNIMMNFIYGSLILTFDNGLKKIYLAKLPFYQKTLIHAPWSILSYYGFCNLY